MLKNFQKSRQNCKLVNIGTTAIKKPNARPRQDLIMTNENLPFFMAVHMDQKLFEITEIHNIIIEYTQTAVNLFWHIRAKFNRVVSLSPGRYQPGEKKGKTISARCPPFPGNKYRNQRVYENLQKRQLAGKLWDWAGDTNRWTSQNSMTSGIAISNHNKTDIHSFIKQEQS